MKRICIFLCTVLIFTSLVSAQSADFKYAVVPEKPTPGEPVAVGIAVAAKQAVLLVNGKQLSRANFFFVSASNEKPGFIAAIIAIPSTANPGPAVIRVENERGVIFNIPFTIAEREFRSETLRLNESLTALLTEPDPQKTAEANRLWAILGTTGIDVYHGGAFVPPVTSTRRTSFFGTRRVYRYSNGSSSTSIHAGIDYGVPTGTEVTACGSGKVILACMRIVSGNSVIIEHAPGVYSIYYHMDKIEVEENTTVSAGALLGYSGATGFATGPHLHWEIRVSGENTDPDAFIARPILDKDLIISKLYNININ